MTSDHARMEKWGKWREVGANVKGWEQPNMHEEEVKGVKTIISQTFTRIGKSSLYLKFTPLERGEKVSQE